MIAVYGTLTLPVAIGVISLVVSLYAVMLKHDKALAALMLGTFLVMGILTAVVCARFDNLIMSAADSFFKTRDTVYKCEGLTEQVCTVKKEVWHKDSLEWIERLNHIKEK